MNINRPAIALVLAATAFAAGGCKLSMQSRAPASSPDILAGRVEKAHGIEAWRDARVISGDVTIYFGDSKILEGSMAFAPHENLSRIEASDETIMIFDGERAWVSPAEAADPMVRFQVLTWPYFLAAPFKLRDPGTARTALPPAALDGERSFRFKLAFDDGVGDSPDDWYIVYVDEQTSVLNGMAYIVTYGTPAEEAEKDPHAIAYHDYERVGGMLLSTRWTFHNWSAENGFDPALIGRAELSNLRVVAADPGMFEPPGDAAEAPLPGP